MQYLGVNYEMKRAPKLDPTFIPFGVWRVAYLKDAKQPIAIAVERDNGQISVHKTFIHGTPEMLDADYRYVERYVKFLLRSIGGFKVYICGCTELAQRLQAAYKLGGEREFDFTFVEQLYERPCRSSICLWKIAPRPMSRRSLWVVIWMAAVSALMQAAPTVRFLL